MPRTRVKDWFSEISDVLIAVVVALFLYGGLVWFALTYRSGESAHTLLLAGIAGSSVGWIIGILASPYDGKESTSFSQFAKLIYGFVGGYVVSKLDPLIGELLSSGEAPDPLVIAILVVALSSCLIAVAVTYITRSYWMDEENTST